MAKLKLGSVITEASGSLGGHTIQNSKGGLQLRNKPVLKKRATAAQYRIRSINPQLQAGWKALSDSDRLIWDNFALSKWSGHSIWMKYQFYYLQVGLPFQLNPVKAKIGPLGPELIDSLHVSMAWDTYSFVNRNIAASRLTIGSSIAITDLIDPAGSVGDRYILQYSSALLHFGTPPVVRFCWCVGGFCSGTSNILDVAYPDGGYFLFTLAYNLPVYFQVFAYNMITSFEMGSISIRRVLD